MTTATKPRMGATDDEGMASLDGLIDVTEWLPGEAPREIRLDEAAGAEGVVCILVDIRAKRDAAYAALRPVCGEDLTWDMVDDLLSMDPLPRVQEYGRDRAIRKVSAFGVEAVEPDVEGETREAGKLVMKLVEFISNDHWIVACSHETESFAGAESCTKGEPLGCSELVRAAAPSWRNDNLESPGDLGLAMLNELTKTYSKARRTLVSWLEHWELRFYRERLADRQTLVNLRGLGAEFSARLNALDISGDDAMTDWFSGVSAGGEALAARSRGHITKTLEQLGDLTDMLRSSFELLQTQDTAEQLRLQRKQAGRTEKLQQALERTTSVFLVPTLIAGFFGANTALPGGNDPSAWMSFEIMVVAMVVGILAAWFGLPWLRKKEEGKVKADEVAAMSDGRPG